MPRTSAFLVITATHPSPSTTSRSHLSHKGSAAPDHKFLEGLCTVQKRKQRSFKDVLKWKDCRTETHETKLAMSQFLFFLSSFCFLKFPLRLSTLSKYPCDCSNYNKKVPFDKGGNWSVHPKKTLESGWLKFKPHTILIEVGCKTNDQLATLTLKSNFLTITYTGINVTKIIFSIVSKKNPL